MLLESFTALKPEDMIPGEEIFIDCFQSWWTEIKNIFIAIAILAISVFLFYYYSVSDQNIAFLVFSAVCFFAFLFLGILIFSSHFSVRYFLTSERIMVRNGIFSKNMRAVPYEKIQDVQLKKTFFENIKDIGDILVNVAGSNEIEIHLDNLNDPEKVYTLILEKMKARREKFEDLLSKVKP